MCESLTIFSLIPVIIIIMFTNNYVEIFKVFLAPAKGGCFM